MSAEPIKGKTVEAAESQIHRIRMTLSSRNVQALERVCAAIKTDAVSKKGLKVAGPVRLPTKVLALTVRKSPCGNGSKTFDRYELKIHKRIIDLHARTEIVKEITAVSIEPGVDIEVAITE